MSRSPQDADRWCDCSAIDQSDAITRGELNRVDLMQAQARRIKRLNPQINAFIEFAPLTGDRLCEGSSPLAGTSFAVKDNMDVAGMRTQSGLRALNPPPATRDALVVTRLRAAGLQFSGRLNMAPMAIGASTRNPDFGDCTHPFWPGYNAGGSSGGSASAVAAGLVSLALGTDTMGSVRLPAAYCGVVGFKPTWEHIPTRGVMPLSRVLDHVGILSRTVADAGAAYQILSARSQPNSKKAMHDQSVLAVPDDLDALGLTPLVKQSFEDAVGRLHQSGMTLRPVNLDAYAFGPARRAGLQLCEAELIGRLASIYPSQREQFPTSLCTMLDFINTRSAGDLARALDCLLDARLWLDDLFSSFAYLALPTSAHQAMPLTHADPVNSADLTAIANFMGAPAISLPLASDATCLPTGLQLIAHRDQDVELLALAGVIEDLLATRTD